MAVRSGKLTILCILISQVNSLIEIVLHKLNTWLKELIGNVFFLHKFGDALYAYHDDHTWACSRSSGEVQKFRFYCQIFSKIARFFERMFEIV